jgi:hypothetical protein
MHASVWENKLFYNFDLCFVTTIVRKRKWSFCCQQNGESFAPQMNRGTVWTKA